MLKTFHGEVSISTLITPLTPKENMKISIFLLLSMFSIILSNLKAFFCRNDKEREEYSQFVAQRENGARERANREMAEQVRRFNELGQAVRRAILEERRIAAEQASRR